MRLRKSCYDCKFKIDNSPSDIIVGDFWGVEFRKELKGIARLRFRDFIKSVLLDAVIVAIKRYLYNK